jgi:cytochrome c peroxidase
MVRNAKAGDIPALIELGARMYIESRYSQNSPFDEEKCAELARTLFHHLPAVCWWPKKTVL